MRLGRRSFLGLLAAVPFAGRALEAMPPAPLENIPDALKITGAFSAGSGSVIRTDNIPKLLWPGLNAVWGDKYRARHGN